MKKVQVALNCDNLFSGCSKLQWSWKKWPSPITGLAVITVTAILWSADCDLFRRLATGIYDVAAPQGYIAICSIPRSFWQAKSWKLARGCKPQSHNVLLNNPGKRSCKIGCDHVMPRLMIGPLHKEYSGPNYRKSRATCIHMQMGDLYNWFGPATTQDRHRPQQIVRTA